MGDLRDMLLLVQDCLIKRAPPGGANVVVYAQVYDEDYLYACHTVALSTVLSVILCP